MSSFTVLVVCVQACLLQSAFGLGFGFGAGPYGLGEIAAPFGCAYGADIVGPFAGAYGFGADIAAPFAGAYGFGADIAAPFGFGTCNYAADPIAYGAYGVGYGLGAPCAKTAAYGGAGIGNCAVTGELPVGGSTFVAGQVPIMGAVEYGGVVPAVGGVTIAGNCACGCGGYGPYY